VTRDQRPDEQVDDLSDPRHPDYDLSEWAPYEVPEPEPEARRWFLRRWVMLIIAIVVVASLMLPPLVRIF
jgi:hypothetical protein